MSDTVVVFGDINRDSLVVPGSDDDILNREDKRSQKKKRRPSFKRRKKSIHDTTQTDSGIDSRMGMFSSAPKCMNAHVNVCLDSNKANNTPEPSTSLVVSNEDDSSMGDYIKDSKVRRERKRRVGNKENVIFTTVLECIYRRAGRTANSKLDSSTITILCSS